MKAKLANKRASGSGELREEARAAKHQTAKQAHSKQPGSLKLLHLMRSSDPEKKPDFILLIPGSQGASPTHSFFPDSGQRGITAGKTNWMVLKSRLIPCCILLTSLQCLTS